MNYDAGARHLEGSSLEPDKQTEGDSLVERYGRLATIGAASLGLLAALGYPATVTQFAGMDIPLQFVTYNRALLAGILPATVLVGAVAISWKVALWVGGRLLQIGIVYLFGLAAVITSRFAVTPIDRPVHEVVLPLVLAPGIFAVYVFMCRMLPAARARPRGPSTKYYSRAGRLVVPMSYFLVAQLVVGYFIAVVLYSQSVYRLTPQWLGGGRPEPVQRLVVEIPLQGTVDALGRCSSNGGVRDCRDILLVDSRSDHWVVTSEASTEAAIIPKSSVMLLEGR